MSSLVGLVSQDMEHLALTIETSLQVNRRFQFFLWSQGALQSFVPHETLVCAYGDIARLNFKYELFSRALVDPELEEHIGEAVNGLLPRMIGDWLNHDRTPRIYSSNAVGDGAARVQADLRRYELGQVVAHGAKEVQGDFGSFFIFLRMPKPVEARDTYMVEVLMPHLHMALHRMLASESNKPALEVKAAAVLSRRQLQVLEWVRDGKTNPEIASILGISPATVKNHVQKMLRKLNVNNRAQAVARGTGGHFKPAADGVGQSPD